MATTTFLGNAAAVAQVETFQVTADDAATTYTMTVGTGNLTAAVSVAGSGTGVNDTATALQVACDAEVHPYFAQIAWTVSTDTVTATSGDSGLEFIAAASAASGTGTIGAGTVTTANTGPNDFGNAGNWSGGAVPSSSDTVIHGIGAPPITTGLDQSALTGIVFHHPRGAGNIGLRPSVFATSANGVSADESVPEYRPTYLDMDCAAITIGQEYGPTVGTAATVIRLNNTRATAMDWYIKGVKGTSPDLGIPVLNVKTAGTSQEIFIDGASGGVGLGVDDLSQTFTMTTIAIADQAGVSKVYVGPGVTWDTFRQDSGVCVLDRPGGGTADVEVNGGTLTTTGTTMKVNTFRLNAGKVIANHAPASAADFIVTFTHTGGTFDASQSWGSRTITTYRPEAGTIIRRNSSLAVTTTVLPGTTTTVI